MGLLSPKLVRRSVTRITFSINYFKAVLLGLSVRPPAPVAKSVEIVVHVSFHALSRRVRGLPNEVVAGGRRPAGPTAEKLTMRSHEAACASSNGFRPGSFIEGIRSRDIVIGGIVQKIDQIIGSAGRLRMTGSMRWRCRSCFFCVSFTDPNSDTISMD